VRAYNLIANGTGGVDWSALDMAVEVFGVPDADFELLVWRIDYIKRYRPEHPGSVAQE
jgi:hypothetical protein